MQPDNTSTVKGRLITFLKHKRISQSEFGRLMGVAPTYVNAMRKSIPTARVSRLCEIFPDLNRDWLIYGEGEMTTQQVEKQAEPPRPRQVERHLTPLVPVDAFAGALQMYSEGVLSEDCELVVSPIPSCDCAIRVSGDSMEPEFHTGSMLLLRKLNEKAFIPWGQPMVLDTVNGVIVKCLYPGDDSFLEAHSYNPAYPPIRVEKDSVLSIYKVIGSVNYYS